LIPWGKFYDGKFHRLVHHLADVAACFEAITSIPTIRRRLIETARTDVSATAIARLSVLAFLHDAGKLNPGFQAKGWPVGVWKRPLRGHVAEGASIFDPNGPQDIADKLCVADLVNWGVNVDLLYASLSHHGRPLRIDQSAVDSWKGVPNYDPIAAATEMGNMMRRWFPDAFAEGVEPLPAPAEFQHLFCGLVSLADWMGSDRRIFEPVEVLDLDYTVTAREKARRAIAGVGLDVATLQAVAQGRATFQTITGLPKPRPQQGLAAEFSLDEQLVILEAETGSGKTEAALWRFARLFEADRVDSLYFALPTRAAAIQIHGRVQKALANLFGGQAPEAVLAVPGYLRAGEVQGQPLPDWKVRWDDDPDEAKLMSRWAAESAKRYLAATVAVGTVDQAMLAALQVKHAHLRAAALTRSFLVIDEVHASDRYMTEVQNHLLKTHLRRGGYAMLMSATLGSSARSKWLGQRDCPSFADSVTAPYPAVWGSGLVQPVPAKGPQKQKAVGMSLVSTMSPEEAGRRAILAAKDGARVLVIRNTVTAAIATWEAVRQAGEEKLLMQVAGGPALHHSRFAPEDRKLLDAAVETALSPEPEKRAKVGVVVIGTQTLEQSLDIDADLLITDLCPVDVLLQRIGRLHRHKLARPAAFEAPQCIVLSPENGLVPLLAPAFENGLGAWRDVTGILQGVYRDLSILEEADRAHSPECFRPSLQRCRGSSVKRVVITATPLIDRWSISGRRDRVSWPPSPDTLFSALVAAAASLGNACHPALYWLEEQGTPNIEADASPPMVESVHAYCPVADRAMWDSKSRQARFHNSIGSPKPVSWSWSITDTSQLEALQAIAREVTYVGSSRGPVLVHFSMAETPLASSALIPMNGGRFRIRGIYPGRLDELEAAFQRGERPKPTIEVPYGCLADLEIKSPWEQMIPLRRSRGPNLHVGRCVPVAEALRQALMSYLPDRASGSLTGHDAGGAVLEKEHLAIVPLAHVQGSYTNSG
jgi:CRISPR-associated endonuclease/helicase Cas3